jgi:FkbM family methyltransferase
MDRVGQPLARRARARRARHLYASFLEPDDLAFDVGANVGDRIHALRSVGARVVAVEPQPSCVSELERRFAGDPHVTIAPVGLAESEGTRELMIPAASTLSSMSPEWIDTVRSSGRFAEFSWTNSVEVRVTTLESLIAQHGRPRFCKIDVEGYEPQVLAGLESPIEALSFEYAHESRENAFRCMARLIELGDYEFCFSPGESMELTGWHNLEDQRERLQRMPDALAWGDVYARLT